MHGKRKKERSAALAPGGVFIYSAGEVTLPGASDGVRSLGPETINRILLTFDSAPAARGINADHILPKRMQEWGRHSRKKMGCFMFHVLPPPTQYRDLGCEWCSSQAIPNQSRQWNSDLLRSPRFRRLVTSQPPGHSGPKCDPPPGQGHELVTPLSCVFQPLY